MLTSNIIHRVLFIKFGNSTASAFTIEYEGKQYLVSAQHVFDACATPVTSIEVYIDDGWRMLDVTPIALSSTGADIAVFGIPNQITPALPTPASSKGAVFGQDAYFLGFPFQLNWGKKDFNYLKPFPIAKKGVFASLPGKQFFLDAINNQGFSGGPVVFKPQGTNTFSIAGVISAYRTREVDVLHQGAATGLKIKENTGLTVCYDIYCAIEAIKRNPVGAKVND